MGNMDDLIAFLNARLDEDKAAVLEATADPGMAAEWNETTSGCLDVGLPDYGGEDWRDYVWAQGDSRVTRFIARHDPLRALCEVEAKRALITFALKNAAQIDGEWGDGHEAEEIADGQCGDHGTQALGEVLRPLAAVYSTHPDYRQEWAPGR